MTLPPWFKPPSEITCPICGAKVQIRRQKNSQFLLKPCCTNCGWNVTRARRDFLNQIRQIVLIATFVGVYFWAVSGARFVALFAAGWMLIGMGSSLVTQVRSLPRSQAAPIVPPLAGIADVGTVTLKTVRPRWNIAFDALIVVASVIAILLLPRELDPARRRLPGIRHELVFVILTAIFAAYQLGAHGIVVFRLVRSIWLEQHLARRAMTARGRITGSNSGIIKYEFLDYSNRLLHGSGRDYTLGLYEDMALAVLYDPDDPSQNMPVVGLQFHQQSAAT